MKIIDYMKEKYLLESPTVLTAGEASAFGIPYPLKPGWIKVYCEREITPRMAEVAIFRLERKMLRKGPAGDSVYHPRGIKILKGLAA